MRLLKESKKLHRQLWLWLAANPDMAKWDWPEWEYNGGPVKRTKHDCFLCERYEYDDRPEDVWHCNCSVQWTAETPSGRNKSAWCDHDSSPFHVWHRSESPVERSRLARQIAGMWR